ncbi:hypothetical protein CWM47_36605 [Spirosoma pollinicola]|uniref:Transposase IS204/IS1001/IS1096/IS1165 DDE domain-containing protein n=1 Tax=Spirosoma pollinicola TaxID=2057025 RepID=A0A2K8ZAL3_9BACT|nr:hypothetical protein CWM47_36605 [Spirosoma pollinicola]
MFCLSYGSKVSPLSNLASGPKYGAHHKWCADAEKVAAYTGFVRGLRQDYAAVGQAFKSQWSNGQTEGQVNRLKMLKRQGYGRAGFDLLRRRVLFRNCTHHRD